ncbi:MAG TPA: DUF2723 domain-containing protein [Longimicrobiales bacterium]
MNQTVKAVRARHVGAASIEGREYRPPYLWAAVAGLAVFALYAVTLAPTTQFWDTSEYIATAHILGIPHPPGNPLFVVLARAWELLLAPTGLSVAVRINLFSAAMSAAAHGFWFLLAHRILAFYSEDERFRRIGAGVAVLLSATAFTVWNQSNVNEKVYTVSLFTIALLSWLAFRWRDNLGRGKDDNLLLLMVFVLALSVGNHLMAFLAAPALVLFILLVNPQALLNGRFYVLGVAVAVVGLSIHLFLPLRASLDPVINEADPSTWQSLWASLARKQYDKPSMFLSPIDRQTPRDIGLLLAQIGNYLQYFDWQWARSVAGNASLFGWPRPLFTLLFTVLGVFGAWTHYRKDRRSWAYVAVLFATLSLGLTFYLNFRYGYTWRRDLYPNMDWHEVRERDYFFIVGFSVWGLWAGIGLAALWRRLAEWVGEARAALAPRRYAVASPVLVFAFLPLFLNWSWASRARDYAARDWAYNLLQSVEPYGVLFTNGDNDTFPLWYLQEVEGIRKDVTVIVMSYLSTPWYTKQIKQLTMPCPPGVSEEDDPTRIICQRRFRPERAPAFYSAAPEAADRPGEPVELPGGMGRQPTRSIIQMSDEEIDRITSTFAANPAAFYVREPVEVRAGGLTFTVPGERLLSPAEVFLLHIVQTAMGDRPIYFASTTQAYDGVGLGPYLIRQGVALKLSDGPVVEDPERGIYRLPAELAAIGPYMDLPRTDSLLWNVFMHRGGIPDAWDHWVDFATQGIPFYYAYTHLGAAQVHAMRGDTAQANRHMERVEAWGALAQR